MTTKKATEPKAVLPAWVRVVIVLAVTAAIFLVPQFLAGMILALGAAIGGLSVEDINDWLASTVGTFATSLLVYGLMPVIMWLVLRRNREKWNAYGLQRIKLSDLFLYATVGFVVYYALLFTALIFVAALGLVDLNQQQEIGFSRETTGPILGLVFIGLVALPALVEEVVFRGFLFTGLRRVLPFWWTTLLVSIVFGALHLQPGNGVPLLWSVMIDTAILSVVLCYVREKTGSIWPAVALHALKNSIAFVALFLA